MQYSNNTIKLLWAALCLSATFSLQAQENSPYSRYGLGNIRPTENVVNRSMGGVSLADNNSLLANPTNPATYTGLRLTSYQFAVDGITVNIKNNTGANRVGAASLAYVNIGLAASKKIGLSVGLMPITRSRYQMENTTTLNSQTQITQTYYGGGGLQRVYIGGAYAIKNLSLGINTGYNFGNLTNTTESEFTDSLKILSGFNSSRTTMGGLFWQLGALYSYPLENDYTINFAATYTGKQKLHAKKEQEWGSYIGELASPDYMYKIDSTSNVKGTVVLPATIGVGMMVKNGDQWQLGLDYTASNWRNFRNYNNADSTTNYWKLKIGGSITPDVNSVSSALKRMSYRAGAYYGQDIFSFNGNNLNLMGFTLGAGMPIRRTNLSIGQINAGIDIGKRGSVSNGMIQEAYTKFFIGLTFNDKWFIKRKYD